MGSSLVAHYSPLPYKRILTFRRLFGYQVVLVEVVSVLIKPVAKTRCRDCLEEKTNLRLVPLAVGDFYTNL